MPKWPPHNGKSIAVPDHVAAELQRRAIAQQQEAQRGAEVRGTRIRIAEMASRFLEEPLREGLLVSAEDRECEIDRAVRLALQVVDAVDAVCNEKAEAERRAFITGLGLDPDTATDEQIQFALKARAATEAKPAAPALVKP